MTAEQSGFQFPFTAFPATLAHTLARSTTANALSMSAELAFCPCAGCRHQSQSVVGRRIQRAAAVGKEAGTCDVIVRAFRQCGVEASSLVLLLLVMMPVGSPDSSFASLGQRMARSRTEAYIANPTTSHEKSLEMVKRVAVMNSGS
ncbi:hypothetical protein EJ05DRAFT_57646 [Pseudovirgaria hyperparasitica]|uniref:Uncharacterized protein n=1 Tax=Pseudovirgaria hyperparasitica TaxID=470096 RepID=A0A6A6W547_9PEZI|nr:uncharacterized protein EJ05DRAFT_57646 [Pseudovirgaria hyperparasitica]KAF2757164.1 hypothetical protein EJ05DRAFT_57646 [Pseudovirgaria hyperparasitica]